MASINKAIIIGRLGKDPQINTFQNGSKIATFTVATSERWTDKQTGEKKERTEWHNVVINSPALVTVAEKYLQKGNQVYIEGTLRTREYTDQNGIKRYTTEIVAGAFSGQLILLESKPADQAAVIPDSTPAPAAYDDLDSEIPF